MSSKNLDWTPVSQQSNQPLDYLHIRSPKEISMETADEMGDRSFWDSLPLEENQNLFSAKKDEL